MMTKRFRYLICLIVVILAMTIVVPASAATTVEPIAGVQVTDSVGNGTNNSGVVTIIAKGDGGINDNRTANNITITNTSGKQATISFDFTISNFDTLEIDGDSYTTNSSYSKLLDDGGTISITLLGKYKWSFTGTPGDATLILQNFNIVEVATTSEVTIEYDNNYGMVTSGGNTVTSGSIKEGSTTQSIDLTAEVKNDSIFLGWINVADYSLLSTSKTYSCTPSNDMTIKAVFVGANSDAWFWIGVPVAQKQAFGFLDLSDFTYHTVTSYSYLFDDLNKAADKAASSTKYIVLANSGTLPSGTYTIPSGVTLLIPFDDANSCYTVNAQWGDQTMTTPTEYRTLTLPEGAELVINGSMSVSGKHAFTNSGGQSGSPSGALGFVRMNSNSSIIVNNGGGLYVYGYIIGTGTVTAKSGAMVYEMMQMPEFRGGTQSTTMEHYVFPLSQYYIQNIEVPLTMESGAVEYAYGTLYAASSYYKTGAYIFGSSNTSGMFTIASGSVTKYYDGSIDQICIKVNGTVNVNPIDLRVDTSSINSKNFVLPINGGYNITLESGSELLISSDQDVLLQPGAQIVIEEGATCTVNSALYLYDAVQWGPYCAWGHANAGDHNGWDTPVIPVSYSPTRTYVRPNVFPRGLFTDSEGKPLYITEDPAIYEAIFGKNAGDQIAEEDMAEFLTKLSDASILVNGTLSGNIYTTADGANICSSGDGIFVQTASENSSIYQFVMAAEDTYASEGKAWYPEAVATPAQLKNADASYVSTGVGSYYYAYGVWHFCTGEPDFVLKTDSLCHWYECDTCKSGEKFNVESHQYDSDNTCTICGQTTSISLVGRTLKYVDVINVICLFDYADSISLNLPDDTGKITDAGMVVWSSDPREGYAGYTGLPAETEDIAVIDFVRQYPDNSEYYYAEADGIIASKLHEKAYFAGYVKVGDTYQYSEIFEYSPSTYAYNMINGNTASTVTPETKTLCVALLNYISAAQQYFHGTTDETQLVNTDLSADQKSLNWTALKSNETEIGTSNEVFTRLGKNLYFDDKVNLAAMFEIASGTDLSNSGTIFWTESQWNNLKYSANNMPKYENHGGQEVNLTKYAADDSTSQNIYYSMCPISIAPKDMATTKIYSMGYVKTDSGYVYSSVKVYGIEDYIANITNKDEAEGTKGYYMKLLAQRLYNYERAAQAALLNS